MLEVILFNFSNQRNYIYFMYSYLVGKFGKSSQIQICISSISLTYHYNLHLSIHLI